MDIINIDSLGFKIENEEKITHSLNDDKIARKAILVEKEITFVLIEKLKEKEARGKITRDISLSTEESKNLEASRKMFELNQEVLNGAQLSIEDDDFWLNNQKYLFSDSEKDELVAIKQEQLTNSILSSEKCNACGKKQSQHSDEVFQKLEGVRIHESIPASPTLCEFCYNAYKPLADKAKTTSQKKVFCIHCNKTLEHSKTPLLDEFKDKYAVRTLCIDCYMDEKQFEECSICFGKKPTIYTSEHQSICLIHGYLLKYHLKTQEESNVVNIGTEQFN